MSEAELHFLAGRLQGAKRAAAERGELRFPLPVGFVYDDEGDTIIDPDAEVQAAVADVFAAFRTGGSAYQVVAAFKGRRFPLRAYGGVWAGQLRWGRLTHSRVLGILANPAYAGTYVFGRYHSRRVVSPDGVVSTKTVELPRDEWPVVIHDHHPGYIGWDDYLTNGARLAANLTNAGARPPREGHALCQGIIGCGSCGRPMTTRYHRNGHAAYECSASRADQMATRHLPVDHRRHRRRRRRRTAPRRPQPRRGRVGVGRRRRGRRPPGPPAAGPPSWPWNGPATKPNAPNAPSTPANQRTGSSPATSKPAGKHRLAALAEADKTLADQRAAVPPLPSRAELETLTADVSAAVARPDHRATGPQTAPAHPHRRRHPAARTRLRPRPASGSAGTPAPPTNSSSPAAKTSPSIAAPIPPPSSSPAASPTSPTTTSPDRLNAAGHTTGAGRPFDNDAVASMRHYHQIPPPGLLEDGEAHRRRHRPPARHRPRRGHPLDQPGMAAGPPRAQQPVVRPVRPRRRSRLPRTGLPIRPHPRAGLHEPAGRPRAHRRTRSPPCSASAPTSSTTGSNATTSTPAAAPAVGCSSASDPTSKPPAAHASPRRSTSSPSPNPKPHGPRARRQYEAIVPTVADRVVHGGGEDRPRADLRGGLLSGQFRVPTEAVRSSGARGDPGRAPTGEPSGCSTPTSKHASTRSTTTP